MYDVHKNIDYQINCIWVYSFIYADKRKSLGVSFRVGQYITSTRFAVGFSLLSLTQRQRPDIPTQSRIINIK